MIDYGTFQFAGVPRAGTTWFMHACDIAGFEGDGGKSIVHTPAKKLSPHGFVVTLVRHPYDWLVSYYLSLKGGATGVDIIDQLMPLARESQGVYSFLRSYTTQHPGVVSDIYNTYKANTVMRVEDLPWCAIEFFDSYGVHKSKISVIKQLKPANARKGQPHLPDPDLRESIINTEAEFCQQYEYEW